MVLTLYKQDASPPVRAIFMVIKKLEITDIEYVQINLLQREQFEEHFLKINPLHTLPTIQDGDFVIWDSHAIAGYLANQYGKDDSLYPVNPKKRAIVDQRLHFDSGILFPTLRGLCEPVIFGGETTFRAEGLEKIKTAYKFTEALFTGNWIAGHDITIADMCCVSSLSSLNCIMPIDASLYPRLSAWLQRCTEQDFYKQGNEPGLQDFKKIVETTNFP